MRTGGVPPGLAPISHFTQRLRAGLMNVAAPLLEFGKRRSTLGAGIEYSAHSSGGQQSLIDGHAYHSVHAHGVEFGDFFFAADSSRCDQLT